jgi:hypothetical protein
MSKSDPKDIELHPEGWPRFERFIKQIAKAGPRHKTSSAPEKKATLTTTNKRTLKKSKATK